MKKKLILPVLLLILLALALTTSGAYMTDHTVVTFSGSIDFRRTVTFKDGETTVLETRLLPGQAIDFPPDPELPDLLFAGWLSSLDAQIYLATDSLITVDDVLFAAQYSPQG